MYLLVINPKKDHAKIWKRKTQPENTQPDAIKHIIYFKGKVLF